MFAAEPAQRLVYAGLDAEFDGGKDEKSKTIRFMVDIQKENKRTLKKHTGTVW